MKRLLVVDDDERFRSRLVRAFVDRGFEAYGAEDASTALLLASESAPWGVVTDLRMPGADGLQLVRSLCATATAPRVVVLTGYGSIATAVEAMRLGAVHYLVKPCHADQILDALEGGGAPDETKLAFETPSLARLEREHIERVIVQCGGNISKAARVLGIHRRTLQYKLAKFPVER